VVALADGESADRFAEQIAEAAARFGAKVATSARWARAGHIGIDMASRRRNALGDVASMLVLAHQRRGTRYELSER